MFDNSPPSSSSPSAGTPGEYLVLARKYRPQTFDDLIGQEHVVRTLKNAIDRHRVHHAYLFTGSRGLGKTSTARIFAKALNCEHGPTPTPCGQCSVCRQIASGRGAESYMLDEIDGASNRDVESARELRRTINQLTSARYHVIIIDEVHMLTTEAFNTLLKTLEEPPAHVKFVFATTEIQKVPETIISRCQRFDFRRIPASVIAEYLSTVAQTENIAADAEALKLIARVAEGGMRDSLSKLDQAIAFCGTTIAAADIERIFGILSRQNLLDLIAGFCRRDFELALTTAARIHEEGLDAAQVMRDLIDLFRDLVVVKTCGAQSPLVDAMADDREKMGQLAQTLEVDTLLYATEILADGLRRLRTTGFPRLALEMTFVKLAELDDLIPVPTLLDALAGHAPVAEVVGRRKSVPAASAPKSAASAPPPAAVEPSSPSTTAPSAEDAPEGHAPASGGGGRSRRFADGFSDELKKKAPLSDAPASDSRVTAAHSPPPAAPAVAAPTPSAVSPPAVSERASASASASASGEDGGADTENSSGGSSSENGSDTDNGNEFSQQRRRRARPSLPSAPSAESAGVAGKLREQDAVKLLVKNFEGEILRVEENDK